MAHADGHERCQLSPAAVAGWERRLLPVLLQQEAAVSQLAVCGWLDV